MELNKALLIAEGIIESLAPHCKRIHLAGSCRRRKPEVKDIEVICLPTPKVFKPLYGDDIVGGRTKKFIETVEVLGEIIKGSPVDGRYNQIQLSEGIKLDLFMPEGKDYFRQFAIRTGSSEYSFRVIADTWSRRGWCGTEEGLRRRSDCIERRKSEWKCVNPNPLLPPVWKSEEEFFEWLGIAWVEPWLRNI